MRDEYKKENKEALFRQRFVENSSCTAVFVLLSFLKPGKCLELFVITGVEVAWISIDFA